jgi:hypothetical protein
VGTDAATVEAAERRSSVFSKCGQEGRKALEKETRIERVKTTVVFRRKLYETERKKGGREKRERGEGETT